MEHAAAMRALAAVLASIHLTYSNIDLPIRLESSSRRAEISLWADLGAGTAA